MNVNYKIDIDIESTCLYNILIYMIMYFWQAIMTNMERYRRHLNDTSLCQVCKGGEESIIHILRDCRDGRYMETYCP